MIVVSATAATTAVDANSCPTDATATKSTAAAIKISGHIYHSNKMTPMQAKSGHMSNVYDME